MDLGLNSRVVVDGNVQGQLHDVLFLLRDAGLPSEDQFFVFNGDYVDRGAWGRETFLAHLGGNDLTDTFRVFMPNRVFLLHGNHESKYCTSLYDFEKKFNQVCGQRRTCLLDVNRMLQKNFLLPPLLVVMYVLHMLVFFEALLSSKRAKGKKSHKIVQNHDASNLSLGSLEELLKAKRFVVDPPYEGKNLIPADFMWSAPSKKDGQFPNDERGLDLLWGLDFDYIRLDEGPDARDKRPDLKGMDEGYTIDNDGESGKLITLFSAPDYPWFQVTKDRYRNKGAYIV
ncbi:hypothetical protein HAX54_024710 [Datura stramonium]|uniref:Serine/threonine specific protein phosphatases domain-containing protein n=1 Tax=Datura stramonium TaxID=4076 RepID=A0ABS8RI42_DATST|nr:hypothetical protein [Datura stramonium]